jgi:hypothetical protein
MSRPSTLLTIAAALLAACAEPNAPLSQVEDLPDVTAAAAPNEITTTWKIPTDDAALAVRSDGLFASEGYSAYANGVCGVTTQLFWSTSASSSGDATIRAAAAKGSKCGRRFRLVYPDGASELVPAFNNLNKLQTSTSAIAIGTEEPRRLILNPGLLGPSRCGRVIFGSNGVVGDGTDLLVVRRVDARTWEVRSQEAPNDRALCESTGEIYNMRVSLVIVASRDLP